MCLGLDNAPRSVSSSPAVAPTVNVELRLLDAQEPERPEDSSMAEDGGHTVKPHGHVRFLGFDPNAMLMTAGFDDSVCVNFNPAARFLKDVR